MLVNLLHKLLFTFAYFFFLIKAFDNETQHVIVSLVNPTETLKVSAAEVLES